MGPTGCPETFVTTTIHCVTSQKSEDLICIAVETLNHTFLCDFYENVTREAKFY
jgi:hypothetical protein